MTILLNNTFELANGVAPTARLCGTRALQLTQNTPAAARLRAEWPTFLVSQSVREVAVAIEVTLPPCETEEAAEEQAHAFIVSIPKGGDSLSFTVGETTVTYAQWALISAAPETLGVTNRVRVELHAVNPTVSEEARLQFESGEFVELEPDTFA